jgi:hypothetical protein
MYSRGSPDGRRRNAVCCGRDVRRLAELSRRTGAHVVVATGLHHERHYGSGHWNAQITPEELGRLHRRCHDGRRRVRLHRACDAAQRASRRSHQDRDQRGRDYRTEPPSLDVRDAWSANSAGLRCRLRIACLDFGGPTTEVLTTPPAWRTRSTHSVHTVV